MNQEILELLAEQVRKWFEDRGYSLYAVSMEEEHSIFYVKINYKSREMGLQFDFVQDEMLVDCDQRFPRTSIKNFLSDDSHVLVPLLNEIKKWQLEALWHDLLLEKTGVKFSVYIFKYEDEQYGKMDRMVVSDLVHTTITRDFKADDSVDYILETLIETYQYLIGEVNNG